MAMDRRGGALLADSEDMLREDGFAGEFLDHYMLEARLPLFGFAGGYWAADDGEVDAARLEHALLLGARERGARDAELGEVREIAATAGGVDIAGERGTARAAIVIVTRPAALASAGLGSLTGDAVEIAATLQPGLTLPSLARSGDGRFRWHSSDSAVRLEADRGLDLEALVAALPVRQPTIPRATKTLAVEDRLPVMGPPAEGSPFVVACAADPCGIAFAAARWVADGLRTGREAVPPAFRSTRPGATLDAPDAPA
jgi:hypothetical protein